MNVVSAILQTEEERRNFERMEKLRRAGSHFIRIVYKGKSQMPRFHGLDQVGVSFVEDPDNGTIKAVAEYGNRKTDVQEFQKSVTGEWMADVVDTNHNRFWLSRHLYDEKHPERRETIEVEDDALRAQIIALIDKPYTESLARQNELEKKKAEIEKELAALITEQNKGAGIPLQPPSTVNQPKVESAPPAIAPTPTPVAEPPKRRPGRPSKRKAQSDAMNAQGQGSV